MQTATIQSIATAVGAFNEVTGAEYQGKNIDRLGEAVILNGFDPSRGFAGFGQWRTVGRTVKRGEHGTPCMTVVSVQDKNNGKRRTAPRGFRVFHFDQTTELDTPEQVESFELETSEPDYGGSFDGFSVSSDADSGL